MRAGILVVLALVAVAVPAQGQPGPRVPARTPAQLAEDVAALRAELTALKEATVQVPTLAESVRELSEKLSVVSARLDELARAETSMPEVAAALDAQRREVDAQTGAVAELRLRLADLEQPHHPGAGAGGGVAHTRGFEWATADGRFGLSIEGYAQPRW
ncbi:MAG TPA: hypothetical protein VJL31_05225, partial [Gemmatimonadales bacterium]|nr:hypothetical protein [Gemmatimonadales bacterium]